MLSNLLVSVPWLAFAVLVAVVIVGPVCASALSVAIEAVQALVPTIGRACDTGDWVTNTIGAVLGGVVAALALVWHRSATRLEPVPVE
ncbi:hypothetical protein DBR36_14160 [Microbacterium sp. HMWF026]|uniref:VanZ family protein n=1 Tax=Microbacterium sp. HMWF026 TaxID=2056861 RepID=UPI000D36ECC1|nr:VanZ family protein [Microbacterium sp. HMWF026]PTT15813.1 hypothetical protein DBR36_14160 [Microbacterium sp. HMWF026]